MFYLIYIFCPFWIPNRWIKILYNNYHKMNRVAITCSSLSIMLMMCMKLLTRIDVVVVTFTRFFSMLCITSSLSSSSSQLLEDKACAKQVFSVMMPSFLPLHSSINFVKLRSCQLALKVRWSVVVMFSERWNDFMVCLHPFKHFFSNFCS